MTNQTFDDSKHPRSNSTGQFTEKAAADPGAGVLNSLGLTPFWVDITYTHSFDGSPAGGERFNAAPILAELTSDLRESLAAGQFDLWAEAVVQEIIEMPDSNHDFVINVMYDDADLAAWCEANPALDTLCHECGEPLNGRGLDGTCEPCVDKTAPDD